MTGGTSAAAASKLPIDPWTRFAAGLDQISEPALALHEVDQLARFGLFPLPSKVVIIHIYVETERAQLFIVEVLDDLQAQIRELLSGEISGSQGIFRHGLLPDASAAQQRASAGSR